MSTTKKLILINSILFVIIGCGLFLYNIFNLYYIRNMTEISINSSERLRSGIDTAREDINDYGGLKADNYDQFAEMLSANGYYLIVSKNGIEIFANLDISGRTQNFKKAFDRSSVMKEDGASIHGNVMIYVFSDTVDADIKYHVIDLNYASFLKYEHIQQIFSIAVICFALSVIIIITIVEINEAAKPLRKLSIATHEIRMGNLDYEIKTHNKDEIGLVYKDFDALRQTLKEARSESERMARDREEYIAGITHDLKTPLTSIMGFSKGLLDGIANTKEKTDKYLNIIYETAKNMNILIEKLKDYSRIDSDKQEFNFKKVNVNTLINDYVSKNALAFHANDVTVTSRLGIPLKSQESTENDFMAMVDVEEFNRVLSNILTNTVKYKHKGMANAEIIVSRGYGQIIITIKDDGPGVKEKELEYIFNCFYRGDSSRTRPTEGSGLGLYVVYRIISAHNGTIKAVNDNGLKIIITLPEVGNEKKNINH